jgi:hypothetical protein
MSNSNSTQHDKFQRLCDNIFSISPNIRFVGILDKMGRLVAGGMRKDIVSMESKEEEILIQSLVRRSIVTRKEKR